MASGDYFIGVDGGGTKCRVRLVDGDGKILGETIGGPANYRLGRSSWDNIIAACRDAARAAGLGEADLKRVHAGMGIAGVIADSYREAAEALPHPFANVAVDNDAYTAWLGAHEGLDGAIFIIGTGSCGLAVIGDVRHNIGGWGSDISDEASGCVIGREALRRTLWVHDGLLPMSPLARELLDMFHGKPEEAVEWARTARPTDLAKLAPRVYAHAQDGDPIATDIIKGAIRDAERILDGLRRCGATRISLVGGLAKRTEAWLSLEGRVGIVPPMHDAIDGAILLVKRRMMAGVPAQ